jgi:predicted Fe-Mo cluster-binding NifX family protein
MKKIVILFQLLLLLSSFTAFAAEQVKIAVAAEGKVSSSQVSAVAGRCSYFLLFDEKGTFIEAVANPHKDLRGGAGSRAVDFLACKDVSDVIAGAFGQKMIGAMQAKGMRYLKFKGNAGDAVKRALKK